MTAIRVAAILLGTLAVPLDSAVNVDFPAIVSRFGLPIPQIQWVVISYTLTSASLLLVLGRAADLVGHRLVFRAGCLISTAAFVLCAAAPDFGWLLGARILQGIGAGLLLGCGPALITSVFPEDRRARALGLYTLAFGVGGALGPMLGGPLIAAFGWSAVFWFRAPIVAAAILMSLVLPPTEPAGRRDRFDIRGGVLTIAAICCLLLALNRIHQPALCAVLAFGTVGMGWLFIRHERRAPQPIIDLGLFRQPGFLAINLGNTLLNLAGFSILLLVPFALARMPGSSVARDGLILSLSPAGTALAAPFAGYLATRIPARHLTRTGALLVAGSLAAIAFRPASIPWMAVAMFAQGTGQGIYQVAYLDRVTGAMPRRQRGVAGSLGMLTRTLGLVTGATVLTLIFESLAQPAGFTSGFQAAFLFAAVIAGVVFASSLRPPVRARST